MADFKHLDALLDQFVANGPAGCGCAVSKDGKVIYEAYRGYADIASIRAGQFLRQIPSRHTGRSLRNGGSGRKPFSRSGPIRRRTGGTALSSQTAA